MTAAPHEDRDVARPEGRARLMLLLAAMTTACSPRLPPPAHVLGDILLAPTVTVLAARVEPSETLMSLLRTHAVGDVDAAGIIRGAAAVFDVRALRRDQPYRIVQAIGGALRRFEYEIDGDRLLTVSRQPDDQFLASIAPIAKRTETAIVRGAIDEDASSLFAAMANQGEAVALPLALADVLSSEIDFNTELQPGDRFEILVEKQYRLRDASEGAPENDDGFAGYRNVLAVAFTNAGRTIRAVRFTPPDGKTDYFDENGRSLRRFFLRSPLKFDPIVTSRFSTSRLHPVLGVTRAHLGVDYRAPVGAPVIAVADGVVLSAAYSGGSGNMVHLRHANSYETQYLHLSKILVRRGAHVRQGELIGRVGMTGLATGPHLDYRVRKDGGFQNPVAVHKSMPPGDPISADSLPAFERAKREAFDALAQK